VSHRGGRLANRRAFLFILGKPALPKGLAMILTCPACGTQYVVKDGAIPEAGRKVRCAACRHSWHQDPDPAEETLELEQPIAAGEHLPDAPEAEEAEPRDYPAPVGDDGDVPRSYAESSDYQSDPATGTPDQQISAESSWDEAPTAEPVAPAYQPYAESVAAPVEGISAPDEVDDDFSPFAERSTAHGRRRSPLVAILVVIVIVAALAAAFWFLAPPEWKSRLGLAEGSQTPLQLMLTHRDRQALASGNELLAVSGRVINPTRRTQPVPPIQAELRSSSGKIVYRWTIAPPTPSLAPGASARFNSAEVNVPSGGEELTVSLGPPGA
jgi:predicted Zn finger-like uncharacterized protein